MSYSASRNKKDSRAVQLSPIENAVIWMNEIKQIIDKKPLAMALFTIGVAFVFLATWQVKYSIYLLESSGMVNEGKMVSALGHLLNVVVVFFGWVDLILLSHLKVWTMHVCRSGFWWLSRLVVIIRKLREEDVADPQQPGQHRHGH